MDTVSLEGKVAIIAGASRGMERGTVATQKEV